MTRRISISLPDDIAEVLDGEPNASAYIADAIARKRAQDATARMLTDAGYTFTEEGLRKARARLLAARARLAERG